MGSSLVQLVRALSGPVVLEEDTLIKLAQIFRRKLGGASFSGEALHAELGIATAAAAPRARATEGATVAVVQIHGLIAQHPHSLGTSTDEIGAQLQAAVTNPRVDAILLDVDSPGGTVPGVPELAAKILAAREVKPITAFANGLMASAAYWLGSAAHEVVVTPSGQVGSIGVYMLHEDWSRNLDQEGVRITAIKAGKYKTEGAPWEPLALETEAKLQSDVDTVYGWFVRAVATGRRDSQANVRNGYGEGRVLMADEALKANLVDRIATFDEAVGRLAARAMRRGGTRADLLRRRLDLDTLTHKP